MLVGLATYSSAGVVFHLRDERQDELLEPWNRVRHGLVVERDEGVRRPGRVREEAGDEQLQQSAARVPDPHHGERPVLGREGNRGPLETVQDAVAHL